MTFALVVKLSNIKLTTAVKWELYCVHNVLYELCRSGGELRPYLPAGAGPPHLPQHHPRPDPHTHLRPRGQGVQYPSMGLKRTFVIIEVKENIFHHRGYIEHFLSLGLKRTLAINQVKRRTFVIIEVKESRCHHWSEREYLSSLWLKEKYVIIDVIKNICHYYYYNLLA